MAAHDRRRRRPAVSAKTFGGRHRRRCMRFGPLDLAIEPRPLRVAARPLGLRQEHAAPDDRRPARAPAPARSRSPAARCAGPQTDIGIVFQSNALVDWRTVLRQRAAADRAARPDRAALSSSARTSCSRSVGLAGFADRHPYELSGGMQQRTAFCRALVHDPPLVLMDEPLGALDAMTREQLRSDLERLWMRDRQDRGPGHPQHRGGGPARRQGGGDLAAARPDRARHRGRPAAPAHSRGVRDAGLPLPMSPRSSASSRAMASSE